MNIISFMFLRNTVIAPNMKFGNELYIYSAYYVDTKHL